MPASRYLLQKEKQPWSVKAIDYDVRRDRNLHAAGYFLFFSLYIALVQVFHKMFGLQCVPEAGCGQLCFAQFVVGACFITYLNNGYTNMRIARDRMERMSHACSSGAYAFLKTVDAPGDMSQKLIIYECLCMIAAFPVVTVQRALGNSDEPAVAKYCRQAAQALYDRTEASYVIDRSRTEASCLSERCRAETSCMSEGCWAEPSFVSDRREASSMSERGRVDVNSMSDRSRADVNSLSDRSRTEPSFMSCRSAGQYNVRYFFETFVIQLELDYEAHFGRKKRKHTTALHLTHCLRNHYENMLDQGSINSRRASGFRESIELLAVLSRELHNSSARAVRTRFFLNGVVLCTFVYIIYIPISYCYLAVDTTLDVGVRYKMPSFKSLIITLCLAAVCSWFLCVLDEARGLWDPFGKKAFNRHGWTLGIAQELDLLLSSFYETDQGLIIRAHSFMPPDEISSWV